MENSSNPRGLGALLQKTTDIAPQIQNQASPYQVLKISEIRPNADQPRRQFQEDQLQQLSDSIKEKGIIQPIIIRQLGTDEIFDNKKYEIIAGERRWRASQLAGLTEIPAIIKDVTGKTQILLLSLIENLQRDDLNPIEEAKAYFTLKENFGLTQDQISQSVSKSRSYVANSIRLLELPNNVKELVTSRTLSVGHAKVLLGIQDWRKQEELAEKAIKEGLSVRQLEEETQAIRNIKKANRSSDDQTSGPAKSYLKEIEQRLQRHFGTKVKVIEGSKKGKIIVEFYSVDDFDRVTTLMGLINV